MSKRIEGVFNIVKNIGKVKFTFSTFLKKLNSSNTFKITEIQKKTKVTIPKHLKKELIRFF
tara:strand:- start:463 stop:645 length:183 start_codon:yes stop_codon:yes gene_type:complete